ncbi:DegV family protein with EDD domain [Cytobacillus firmus]|uniref:DegV family protein with EDD domain n=2 Tax=Cytobacillus TaxID=2675230 RepID=A0A366JTM7_CYTFI|nr:MULTISPECIES: DegV family protein [Cytobacillus]RBP92242.1 DegV family protein with EDD domain [Cytobacillus firmus]TDX42073.1 DegV family protein with EDD domain [Cytobacillus oceanisediminis]
MSVKILADSACDLPLSFYEENSVTLFPLKVQLNDTEYEDLVTIEPKSVYDAIREGQVPKTSQVSPLHFEKTFMKMAERNEDGIYVSFSSGLSGTYQTAVMILEQVKEKYPDFKLSIIDSKAASLGYGLIVKSAAAKAQSGASKEDIQKDIDLRCRQLESLFTVNDLEYLAKGGRVSKASAFLGGLLNIKPLLTVEDGKLVPIEKLRGKKKLLRRIIELMKENGTSFENQTVGISHADDEDTAFEMQKLILEEFKPKEVYITSIGSAIGSHTGPGTIAIFYQKQI